MFKVDVKLDTSGMDRIRENLKKLSGDHTVSEVDLFPDSFMQKCTDFKSISELKTEAGVTTREEIDTEPFSEFIKAHTHFDGWKEMLKQAYAEYASRTLRS